MSIETPLLSAIREAAARSAARFHTPGHKGRPESCVHHAVRDLLGNEPFAADFTEIPGLDNLLAPAGVLRQAERLCARAFGANESVLLTCGASSGVVAAILATSHPGGRILVPRECHRSVLSGVILSGAEPIFYPSQTAASYDLPAGFSADVLYDLLCSTHATALVLNNPNYFGVCCDLHKAVALARKLGAWTIVDEAHGAHLPFVQPAASAISWGADIVVHGAHKTLGVLTQGALVHFAGDPSVVARFRDSLRMVHTTSPSYPVLASLDGARAGLEAHGKERLSRLAAQAADLKSRLAGVDGLRVFPGGANLGKDVWLDPFKITVAWKTMDATTAERKLIEDHGVCPELVCGNNMLFLVGEGDDPSTLELLEKSLREVASGCKPCEPHPSGSVPTAMGWTRFLQEPWPQRRMSPREAFFAPHEKIPAQKAVGRVCGEPISLYPPGVPLIWPGEAFTSDLCSFLMEASASGWNLIGIDDSGCLEVCTEG